MLGALECRTVVDIGANRGQFALVARRSFPDARIISFEPLPQPARQFRAVFSHDSRVELHECAIAPKHGCAPLHISKRDDSSSLLPIGALQSHIFPGTQEIGTATVAVAPLDEYVTDKDLDAPALLKLDVQGFELQALQGCERLLSRFAFVYVECSYIELYAGQALADEVIAWLHDRGFSHAGTYNLQRDSRGNAVQGDFLFKSINQTVE